VEPTRVRSSKVSRIVSHSSRMLVAMTHGAGALRGITRSTKVRSVSFGFVAQVCSSATNLALAVIGGHILGPSGLGTLYIGFGAYIALLGLHRALVTQPLIAISSSDEASARIRAARYGLTASLVPACVSGLALAGAGWVLPDQFGRGMLLFAPWLIPALIQDMGRSLMFRDEAGWRATASDATWLVAMAVFLPFTLLLRTDWAVLTCWGLGACAGAGVVLFQIRLLPARLGPALLWWRRRLWPLGRWLTVQVAFRSASGYAAALSLAWILGPSDYGGLRSVNVVFVPLSLIGAAVALPGLPLISRATTTSPQRALRTSTELGLMVTALTAAYVGLAYSFQNLLGFAFGSAFLEFRSIVMPVGLGQLLMAPTYGLTLLLIAQQRGRSLVALGIVLAGSQLLGAVGLGLVFGLDGAAWGGGPLAAAIYLVAVGLVVLRRSREARLTS